MRLRPCLLALLLPFAAPAQAGIVAASLPFQGTPDWTDIVFSGTSMVRAADGSSSTLTTANNRGVWFGWGTGYSDPAPAWTPGTPAAGNYLQLGARFSPGAADWSAYFYDTSHEAAILFGHTNCANNCYGLPAEAGVRVYHADPLDPAGVASTFVPVDLQQHHVYEVLLKAGRVTYHIDGEVAFVGAALVAPLGSPLVVIGDGSGSTLSGVGAMTVTRAVWDNAPGFDTVPGQSFTNANALFNAAGQTLTVAGTFRNILGGSLGNAGTLDVTATGTLANAGTLASVLGGVIRNRGRFQAASGGAGFESAGTFENLLGGSFENAGTATNRGTGVFTNRGTMTAALGGASFRNEGTLQNVFGGVVENRGSLVNAAGATLSTGGTLTNLLGGSLSNAGTMTTAPGGVLENRGTLVAALGGATFRNAGVVENRAGATFENRGAVVNALGGVINNAGTLLGGLGGAAGGASFANVGTLNNLLGGAVFGGAAFTNSSANTVNNEGTFTVDGVLTNAATGVFRNLGTGVIVVDAGGTLLNDGWIANAGSITNAGTVQVGADGRIDGAGTYRQSAGVTQVHGVLSASRIDIEGGRLEGARGMLAGDVVRIGEGAVLAPGGDGQVGTLGVRGDLALGGALHLDLQRALGLVRGDRIEVDGELLFLDSAVLRVRLDFLPQAGDEFELLRAGSIAGLAGVDWRVLGGGGLEHDFTVRDGVLFLGFGDHGVDVPVPGTGALLVLGIALGFVPRRRARPARRVATPLQPHRACSDGSARGRDSVRPLLLA